MRLQAGFKNAQREKHFIGCKMLIVDGLPMQLFSRYAEEDLPMFHRLSARWRAEWTRAAILN